VKEARGKYNTRIEPIEVQRRETDDCMFPSFSPVCFPSMSLLTQEPRSSTAKWEALFTKLLAFNQTQYDRMLALDLGSIVWQNLDELSLISPSPVAALRAYW